MTNRSASLFASARFERPREAFLLEALTSDFQQSYDSGMRGWEGER